MSFYLFDSVLKKKVEFVPVTDKEAKMYVCGPTVYGDAHLGHARSSIVFDLLRRVLRVLGFKVTFVKNFTDIDDKIIKKMSQEGKSLQEITEHYIKSYKEDMHALGVEDADIEPKATQSLQDMFELIQKLIDKDFAYKTSDGIYFDTSKDSLYLSISHRFESEDEVQSRVEANKEKINQKDFALWKFSKEGELFFESPFGDGRPGWHIECSAMINKHLNSGKEYQIDIHGGGADLLFPHHENEAAQTRCAAGQTLAKYWMHNGFVNINGEKMSKSLGNSFFIKDALRVYDGEILRFYLLGTYYRANLNFNEEDLLNSKKRLDKIYRLKKRVYDIKASHPEPTFTKQILSALADDLNISKALSSVDEMVSSSNELLDANPKDKAIKRQIKANIDYICDLLGVGKKDPYGYFQLGVSSEEKSKIEGLIKQRALLKKEKDFIQADKIRDKLLDMKIKIMDTPSGTVWEVSD